MEDGRHAAAAATMAALVHNVAPMKEAEVETTLDRGILFAEALEIPRFSRPIRAPEVATTFN